MKRTFSIRQGGLIAAGTALIAATYGLVRLAYGLHLPEMQADFGFDARAAGLISAGGSLMYCLGALVGFAAAAGHERALVAAAGAGAALGSWTMAAATETGGLAAGAVLSSVGAGLASPALVTVLNRSYSALDRPTDRAQTLVNAGTGPGLVLAGVLALVVVPRWRIAWVVAGIAAALAAVTVLALADRRGSRSAPPPLPPARWFAAHRHPITAALLLGAGSAAVWSYGRTLLTSVGAAESASTLAWIALGIGGTTVLATSGWIARLPLARAWAVTTGAVAAGSLALWLTAGSPAAPVACLVFGWGYTAATGVLISWTARIDPERSATGTALLFVLLVAGQAAGAALTGLLVDGPGYPAAFGVAAVVAGIAALIDARPLSSPRAPRASTP